MTEPKELAHGGRRIGHVVDFLVLLSLLGCRTPAPNLPPEELTVRLEQLLTEARDYYNIPAIGVIIVKSNRIVDSITLGVRDVNGDDPATADDYFHLGSNTKAITAYVAATLVEDGLVDWNTRFFDLVPELIEAAREEYASITLADLLSHRAWVQPFVKGPEMSDIPVIEGDVVTQRLRFSEYILREAPTHRSSQSLCQPYAYSNAGYVLAAVMIERASGMSWEELVQKVMVDDLGLHAVVGFPIEIAANQPRGHLPGSYLGESNDTLMIYDTEYVLPHEAIMNPAGDLSMRMTEYAEFIQIHLRGLRGEDNYLSAEAYEFMHFGVDLYAMGWNNGSERGIRFSEHDGSRGNFYVSARIIPERDLAIITFANSGILNALKLIPRLLGSIRLKRYFGRIQALYE